MFMALAESSGKLVAIASLHEFFIFDLFNLMQFLGVAWPPAKAFT